MMATVTGMLLILGVGAATARGGFSMHSLKGGYASTFSGKLNIGGGTLVPIMGTGLFIADGHGHLTGHETYTVDTTVCDASISGSYTIDPDGTGTDSITFTPPASETNCQGGSYTQSLAIAENRKLVLLSNTNGDQIDEQWHRQR
jgi:hypothetical protein